MTLFVGGLMETPEVDGPPELREIWGRCAIDKGRAVSKHEQDKPANNVAQGSIARHVNEQIDADIEEHQTSNTTCENEFLISESQESLFHCVQGRRNIKLAGTNTGRVQHNFHGSRPDRDSSESCDDNAYNMPIRTHRSRAFDAEYFDYDRMRREMREAEGFAREDWDDDDETELGESLWDSTSEGEEPPAPPTRDGVGLIWERHHDSMVWASRGTADEIRSKVQFLYRFSPPISEEFILGRLNGRFASMHLEFLFRYLPGETGTIQQASDRIFMQTRNVVDSDIIAGRQAIRIHPASYLDPAYQVPPMPSIAPVDWERHHDAMLNIFLGKHPMDFLEECGDFLENGACIEFLQIRMAQSMHLGISLNEMRIAFFDDQRE